MKARTAAAKRKSKQGRPRLPAVEREENGRLSRRKLSIFVRKQESAKKVREVARAARSRVYGVPEKQSERPEAGYALGRLFLAGHIDKDQLDAGDKFAEDHARYYGLTGIPFPSPRAQDLFRVKGAPGPDRPLAAKSAANAVMRAEMALGMVDRAGRPVMTTTKRVCVLDDDENILHPYTLFMLRKGLDALVVHYKGET